MNSHPLASLGGIIPTDNLGAPGPLEDLAELGDRKLELGEANIRPDSDLVPHAAE